MLVADSQIRQGFIHEMRRFLPPKVVTDTIEKDDFWMYLVGLIKKEASQILKSYDRYDADEKFRM